MLTIHHLRIGRSLFTVWLLEELELEYDLLNTGVTRKPCGHRPNSRMCIHWASRR